MINVFVALYNNINTKRCTATTDAVDIGGLIPTKQHRPDINITRLRCRLHRSLIPKLLLLELTDDFMLSGNTLMS